MLQAEENELPRGRREKNVSLGLDSLSWTPDATAKLAILGRPYSLNLSIPICDVWIIRPMLRSIQENLCRVAGPRHPACQDSLEAMGCCSKL